MPTVIVDEQNSESDSEPITDSDGESESESESEFKSESNAKHFTGSNPDDFTDWNRFPPFRSLAPLFWDHHSKPFVFD
jgi:hypothetical protein